MPKDTKPKPKPKAKPAKKTLLDEKPLDIDFSAPVKQPSLLVSVAFVLLSVGVVLATGAYVWWQSYGQSGDDSYILSQQTVGRRAALDRGNLYTKFASETDFKDWLAEADEQVDSYVFGGMARNMAMPMFADTVGPAATEEMGMGMAAPPTAAPKSAGGVSGPDRFSGTNVQVVGIDEPDIVKTNGQQIYFSSARSHYPVWRGIEPMIDIAPDVMIESVESSSGEAMRSKKIMPDYRRPQLKSIKAFPPADLELEAEIDRQGEMLLYEDTLIVLDGSGLFAYDVSDPADPAEKWEWKLEDGVGLQATRLMGDKVYLVTRTWVNQDRPCPVPLMGDGAAEVRLTCSDVWHPISPQPTDVTFSVVALDAESGESLGQPAGFVGSSQDTTVYMSAGNIYMATGRDGDAMEFMYGFLKANDDLTPDWVISKIGKVKGYDLSDSAKNVELQQVIARWMNSLSGDERIELENEYQNRMENYYSDNLRNWESTSLVKVSLTDLSVKANGSVPGRLLNQFSMDESDGNLRVAVTVGGRQAISWQFGIGNRDQSISDVYVLDSGLKQLGAVTDMGEGERIYSVRFLGDRGYVVTFRETDPFYVLDLSDSRNPLIEGELKIPGFSSYLHPIGTDRVLGVGKEGSQVKLSLFGVSDPTSPKELSRYTLKEYWTDVNSNHHAFLMDSRHDVFFLPGGSNGYIFSYKGDDLAMARAVGDIQAKRAIYIDDYMYIIGEDKLVVLNESDWQEVNNLDLTEGLK